MSGPSTGFVSWRIGGAGFGAVHLEERWPSGEPSGKTICGIHVPLAGRIARSWPGSDVSDLCRNCVKEYAKTGAP